MQIVLVGDNSEEQSRIISALHAIGHDEVRVIPEDQKLTSAGCLSCESAIHRSEIAQQVIVNIANAVGISKDLNDLYSFIGKELNRLIDAANLFIAIYDPVKDQFLVPFQHDNIEQTSTVIPAGKTLSRYLYTRNEAMLLKFDDIERMAHEGIVERKGVPAQAWMGVPLRSATAVFGVLVVQNYENQDAYSPEDLELLKFVSNQIRISIERKKTELDLIIAKEKAIESDKLKSSFLTNMSHEVRTPMNAIIGFSTLLNDPEITPDESEEYISLITSNAELLLKIIDNVIEVARLESGEVVLERKAFGINQAMLDLLEESEKNPHMQPNVSVNISSAGSDGEYMLYNDQSRVLQMLKILVDNAIKFTEQGTVDFGYQLIDDKFIEFIVRDTGVGIPLDQQTHIFERFNQADNSLTRKFGGTGLGLTIVKHLVELMGGHIELESVEGKGSTFRILIPLVKPAPVIIPGVQVKSRPTYDFSDKHLLVVEDVESNYQYLVAVLKSTKVNIHWITNGNAAIEFCQNFPDVNMVFMDVNLPGIDGYEATRQIKAIKPDLPVIALTAYAMTGEKEKSLEAGCDEYLSKPVSPKELLNTVVRYLQKVS